MLSKLVTAFLSNIGKSVAVFILYLGKVFDKAGIGGDVGYV